MFSFAVAATPLLVPHQALAQQPMLVSPDGRVLEFTPDRGDIVISRDRIGRKVYYDRYGNLVATEMPNGAVAPRREAPQDPYYPQQDDSYYPPAPGQMREPQPQYGGVQQGNPNGRDFREYRGDGTDPDVYTGSVATRPGDVESGPLGEPMPGESTTAIVPQPDHLVERNQPVTAPVNRSRQEIVALQVFLDREGISPGVIDGKMGDNVNKAIAAWQDMTGERLDPNNTDDILERLRNTGGLAIVDYTITAADAAGPYVASIPDDYAEKAQLPAMAYTSTSEALAERFHMDETYLKELNPGVDFTVPGTIIKVVSPGDTKKGQVARIVAHKGIKQVFAYDESGVLIAAYPATIGSSDTPSPSGTHTVERIALNPGYTYNPKINFQQGQNSQILQIPPGPNGPVGTVWIALSKPTYGIHGTPEPSKIGKTNSHGCIRLTNWDATELAKMVRPGVVVEFAE
ncbi:L,D-transpeptidase [Agrobacterium rubi]|uniref:L,D-transpeptidase n=2 Tax=Agrobacterium rubi TaxID=28099 RepID=A0AAE7URM5_9HYPH|nr:L,D-transpeptidase [Agrobacterium rubi]NTE86859.1 L,D-transpeptidase [Agrobacterium rubi]NTF02793.1 L,D-transpeptidase [Agrobacterium rubi]NTF37037.1 L,D-transpeptidase [Agrobacterium rubi]QTG01527.1 L,D-transpeptidase [Agrobacterium rubi]